MNGFFSPSLSLVLWAFPYAFIGLNEARLPRLLQGLPHAFEKHATGCGSRSFKTGIWAWSSSALKTFSLYSVQYLLFMGVPAWLFDEWTQLFHTIAWAESKSLFESAPFPQNRDVVFHSKNSAKQNLNQTILKLGGSGTNPHDKWLTKLSESFSFLGLRILSKRIWHHLWVSGRLHLRAT